jgi:ribonuclease HI
MPPRKKKAPDPRGVTPIVDTVLPYTTVFTDGSSTGAVGPGGWAWAVENGPENSGGAYDTTNQRMELQAAMEAVAALPGLLLVVSDSSYVVNGFAQEWWKGWHRRGWLNSTGNPVANRDLWEPFVDMVLARQGEVKFAWIKGHTGNPMNDRVDELAKAARIALPVRL